MSGEANIPIIGAAKSGEEQKSFSLATVPSMISGGTLVVVILSALYETAYYSVIGSKFQNYMVVADYINLVFDFLIPALITGLCAFFISYSLIRMTEFRRSSLRSLRNEQRNFVRYQYFFLTSLALSLVILINVIWPILNFVGITKDSAILYCLPASCIWAIITYRVRFVFFKSMRDSVYAWVIFVPISLLTVYVAGFSVATREMHSPRNIYLLSTKNPEHEMLVVLLKNLQRGIVVRIPAENRNTFVRAEDVARLSYFNLPASKTAASCRLLDLFCKP